MADYYLPVDETQIPNDSYRAVNNTIFDFREEGGQILSQGLLNAFDGAGQPGIDHSFVVQGALVSNTLEGSEVSKSNLDPASYNSSTIRPAATLICESARRKLEVFTTHPGVQIYTANWLDTTQTNLPYTQHNAICLETQHFPDSVNQCETFPSVILTENDHYHQESIFALSLL
jgi:aldose 1-epimerase